ncbi:MAG TPA: fibronectin type III domain-containing protein, partial [Candidatus Paceibacterota bacterium]|nr:fibronectin type III domain-containing protein [Candidatus Paceibacterota bacterium]
MIWRIVCVLLIGVASASTAHALESTDRIVTQSIDGPDTFPPTVPNNVTATPLAGFTIELNWDASTDNVGVSGYQVWRDDVQIATTTLITYTDSGLASSTSYTYYLTAFDAAGNISASSSPVVATTQTPVEPVIREFGAQLTRGADISDLQTTVTENSITLSFRTDRFAQAQVQWLAGGEIQGVAQGNVGLREHQFFIDGLQPETVYELDISVSLNPRFVADQERLTVTTRAVPDRTPPANVSALTAVPETAGVALSWQNPADADFDRVRVVRSTRWFPLDTVDGWVVYEGAGTSFTDGVLQWPAYYTVFSIDAAGNVSSGAVVVVYGPGPITESRTDATATPANPETPLIPERFRATTSAPVTWPVFVDQLDRVTLLSTTTAISLYPNAPFTVRIPARVVPPALTTIVAELSHPDPAAGQFSFLLRRSADGEA